MPIFNLMEDAATAEISRSQVWQWIRSPKGKLDDGRKVTKAMVAAMIPEEMEKIRALPRRRVRRGQVRRGRRDLRRASSTTTRFVEFLTLPAYERID